MHSGDAPLSPQIKVCGLTDPQEAAACAALGADAIGLVFYPPSPRHLALSQAAAISAVLPETVRTVGVFVDPTWDMLCKTIECCRLDVVQLHGAESQALVDRIQSTFAVAVIKALFAAKAPSMADAAGYRVAAFLVECGRGALPGGNASVWDWGAAAEFARRHPTVLAGGLSPDNVARAIAAALPDAVDASSGLEASPGRKDLHKVRNFIAAVRETAACCQESGKRMRLVFARQDR